jgi:hypothetical protein
MMSGIKMGLISAVAVGGTEAATLVQASAYERLGIVGLCTIALIAVWRQGEKRQDKMEKALEAVAKIAQESVDVIRRNNEVIDGCHRRARMADRGEG